MACSPPGSSVPGIFPGSGLPFPPSGDFPTQGLLGLPAEEPEPEFPPVPEPRCFAHYDVQSLLFDWSPRPRGPGAQAEASSGTPAAAQDQTASSDLLLEAPGFVSELGGEGELGLGGPVSPPVPPSLPNAAVSVLEEPQNRTSAYSLEHADLGAGYYRKYFYGKGKGQLQRAVLSVESLAM